jgi:hypothetical protein
MIFLCTGIHTKWRTAGICNGTAAIAICAKYLYAIEVIKTETNQYMSYSQNRPSFDLTLAYLKVSWKGPAVEYPALLSGWQSSDCRMVFPM